MSGREVSRAKPWAGGVVKDGLTDPVGEQSDTEHRSSAVSVGDGRPEERGEELGHEEGGREVAGPNSDRDLDERDRRRERGRRTGG